MNMKEMKAKRDKYMRWKMPDDQKWWAELLKKAYEKWEKTAESTRLDSFEAQAEAVIKALKKKRVKK
jgi:tRNA uridine 5-carbamoylmethylation protein Kti12